MAIDLLFIAETFLAYSFALRFFERLRLFLRALARLTLTV
jgi:hypothetical protein